MLSSVPAFVTQYTSIDPFHANDYADKVLSQGTGQFAKLYQDKMNEVVIQVARAEPTVGTVQALGIERWNRRRQCRRGGGRHDEDQDARRQDHRKR